MQKWNIVLKRRFALVDNYSRKLRLSPSCLHRERQSWYSSSLPRSRFCKRQRETGRKPWKDDKGGEKETDEQRKKRNVFVGAG